MKSIVSFREEDVLNLLQDLEIDVREAGEDLQIVKNGKQALCEQCQKPLTTKNLGVAKAGSDLLFCDNPLCFLSHER